MCPPRPSSWRASSYWCASGSTRAGWSSAARWPAWPCRSGGSRSVRVVGVLAAVVVVVLEGVDRILDVGLDLRAHRGIARIQPAAAGAREPAGRIDVERHIVRGRADHHGHLALLLLIQPRAEGE